MPSFLQWLRDKCELQENSRYSVEVNFRTRTEEVLLMAAKITLGFASAALKKADFHVKQVFEVTPYRILVTQRNWDDGSWTVVVSWDEKNHCYMISKGFYSKDRKTVSVQKTEKCKAENASEIAAEVKRMLHSLKNEPDRHIEQLKKVPFKRGPKG